MSNCIIEDKTLLEKAEDFIQCPNWNVSENDILSYILAVAISMVEPDYGY